MSTGGMVNKDRSAKVKGSNEKINYYFPTIR